MMRLLRSLFAPLPKRHIPESEQALIDKRAQLEAELEAMARHNRQRSTLFLLEQEVDAVTAGRRHRSERGTT